MLGTQINSILQSILGVPIIHVLKKLPSPVLDIHLLQEIASKSPVAVVGTKAVRFQTERGGLPVGRPG